MAAIVSNLLEGRITYTIAKDLLVKTFQGDRRDINTIIMEENLAFRSLPREFYENMARKLIDEKPELVQHIQKSGKYQKIQWFVGQMMQRAPGKGKMEPRKAEAILKELILGIVEVGVWGDEEKKGEDEKM